MRYNFPLFYRGSRSYNSFRLLGVFFVMAALFFSTFCLTASTASAHGGHTEDSSKVLHLNDSVNEECCHGIFHDKNHESIKIIAGNQQIIKQMVAADTSNFPNFIVTDISTINDLGYLENFKKGASPPNSILRC